MVHFRNELKFGQMVIDKFYAFQKKLKNILIQETETNLKKCSNHIVNLNEHICKSMHDLACMGRLKTKYNVASCMIFAMFMCI